MSYHQDQPLNDWVEMLHSIYGLSQNYARSEYEILAHLSEVTGAFSKYLFKLRQPEKAQEFLPKMFGWAVALLKKVKGDKANLEEIILTKFPTACPYCLKMPCECVPGKKRPVSPDEVRNLYSRRAAQQGRSIDDFQNMFLRIYGHSWGFGTESHGGPAVQARLQNMYTRLVEEISELGEAVRFSHLYPTNFDNELADYVAWLFAFVCCLHYATDEIPTMFLSSELFWPAYPGICSVCMLEICDCRPSPVRELQSKPALRELAFMDGLTQTANRARFDGDIQALADGKLPFPNPITCIRIDVDDFRRFNNPPFDHGVGDEALKTIANVIRQKVRPRDRVYRVGGDEFAVLCPDLSGAESAGMMSRIALALRGKRLTVPQLSHGDAMPPITLSVGIAQAADPKCVSEAFDAADIAAIDSKNGGKDRITIAK